METYIGKSVPRLDGAEKVTGQAVYTVDVELPNMLHAAVLRSTRPHARIVELDVSDARTAPGVKAVITGKDFPYTHGGMIKDQPFIAIDRVRYVGEVVAAVAAETEAAAQEAVSRIRVRYEDLPAVFDPKDAIAEGAPILHEGMAEYPHSPLYENIPGTNVCTIRTFAKGDVQAGFAEADEVYDDEFYIHAVAHTPMETHAALAQRSPADGGYTVWSSSDGPHRRSKELAEALGLAVNKVRVLSMYSGGGFGGKGTLVAEAIVVALAAFTGGRPVKMVFSREEELSASQTRHAAYLQDQDGREEGRDARRPERRPALGQGGLRLQGPGRHLPGGDDHLRPLPDTQRGGAVAAGLHQQADRRRLPGLRRDPGDLGLRGADGHDRPAPRDRPPGLAPEELLRGERQVHQRPGDEGRRPDRDPGAGRQGDRLGQPQAPGIGIRCAAAGGSPRR